MSPRMTHICLHVKDVDECTRFYKDYCKLQIIDKRINEGKGSVYLSEVG